MYTALSVYWNDVGKEIAYKLWEVVEEMKIWKEFTSEFRRQEETGAQEVGQLLTLMWGAMTETENTNNILNR